MTTVDELIDASVLPNAITNASGITVLETAQGSLQVTQGIESVSLATDAHGETLPLIEIVTTTPNGDRIQIHGRPKLLFATNQETGERYDIDGRATVEVE